MHPLLAVLRDPERKTISRILVEAGACAIRTRELPYHYFEDFLYRADSGNADNYLSKREQRQIKRRYFRPQNESKVALADKIRFSRILEERGIPTPLQLATSADGVLHASTGRAVELRDDMIAENALKDLCEASGTGVVFVKPCGLSGGVGCYRVSATSDARPAVAAMSRYSLVYQEAIEQHPRLSEVYPNSVNTVRIHTFRTHSAEKPTVFASLVRFGSGGNVVDNGSCGGMFAALDLKTGRLQPPAKQYLKKGGRSFWRHPDTGYPFEEFVMPYRHQVKEIVIGAAESFDRQIIGWDVAVAPDGPVIIEGNSNPHLSMMQIAARGLRRFEFFGDVVQKGGAGAAR